MTLPTIFGSIVGELALQQSKANATENADERLDNKEAFFDRISSKSTPSLFDPFTDGAAGLASAVNQINNTVENNSPSPGVNSDNNGS